MAWVVHGTIRIEETGAAVPGLVVRAWDSEQSLGKPLGETTSDEGGHFSISYQASDFDVQSLETAPDLFIRIHVPCNDRVIQTTQSITLIGEDEYEQINIDMTYWAFRDGDDPYLLDLWPKVRGRVIQDRSELPIKGLMMVAKDVAHNTVLATSRSSAEGVYSLWFEKKVDLILLKIVAIDPAHPNDWLHESGHLFYDGTKQLVHEIRIPESRLSDVRRGGG